MSVIKTEDAGNAEAGSSGSKDQANSSAEDTANIKVEDAMNIKVDDETKAKVLAQMEYYFGDVNLPRDTFMKGEMAKNDGWIELATMMKFNRLRNLLSNFEEKAFTAVVLEVLQGSSLVEVDSSGTKLRRSSEFPAPEGRGDDKTVYLKNFNKTETTLDELLDYFKKTYEGVEAVILRHYNRKALENGEIVFKREFKGSIFVVFKTVELAQALLDEPKTSYKGVELIKMMQKDYNAKKLAELQARSEARKKKKEQQQEGKTAEEGENQAQELGDNIFLKILDVPEGLSREDIKASWANMFKDNDEVQIAFIDFNRGEKDAVLRLEKTNAAKQVLDLLAKSDNPTKIAIGKENSLCDIKELDEAEEKAHRAQVAMKQQMRQMQRKRNTTRGRGGGHKRRRRN